MKYSSEITLKDLSFEYGSFVKLIWNGKTLFDDDNDSLNSKELLKSIDIKYANKKVYEYRVTIVHFHHSILDIVGED